MRLTRFAIAKWMPALLVGGLVASLAAALLVVLAGRARERGPRLPRAPRRAHRPRRRDAGAGRRRRARRRRRRSTRLGASRATLERVLAEIDDGPLAVRGAVVRERAPPRRRVRLERAARDLEAGARPRARSPARSASPRRNRAPSSAACWPRPAMPCRRRAARSAHARPAALRDRGAAHRATTSTQLEAGVEPGRGSRQRITENTALLAQFLAGLAGADKTAGVPAVEGEAATRLAEVQDGVRAPTNSSCRARSSRRGARGRAARRRRPRHGRRRAREVARRAGGWPTPASRAARRLR